MFDIERQLDPAGVNNDELHSQIDIIRNVSNLCEIEMQLNAQILDELNRVIQSRDPDQVYYDVEISGSVSVPSPEECARQEAPNQVKAMIACFQMVQCSCS